MKKSLRHDAWGLFLVTLIAASSNAQPPWNPDPMPPCSVRQFPFSEPSVAKITYDPSDGILRLDTLGEDGISNTVNGTAIGGDDVGAIAVIVRGPEPLESIPPFTNGNLDTTNMIVWNYFYAGGKAQLIGATIPPMGMFILPGVNALFQYETGLGPADFHEVELNVNFGVGQPGAMTFCEVTVVPEPMMLSAFAIALAAWAAVRRR